MRTDHPEQTPFRQRLNEARECLGLPHRATLEQIKQAHRRRVWECHPDHAVDEEDRARREKEMIAANSAYEFLMEYCARYRYDLTGEEAHLANYEEFVDRHFGRGYSGA